MGTSRKRNDGLPPPETEAAPAAPVQEPIGVLLHAIIGESGKLVRQEMELARTELAEKLVLLQRYTVSMVLGGILFTAALFFLLSALDHGFRIVLEAVVASEVVTWLAPLLLALVLGLLGWAVIASARRMLRVEGLTLSNTAASLRESAQWIKKRVR
jgi:hypothetical protein